MDCTKCCVSSEAETVETMPQIEAEPKEKEATTKVEEVAPAAAPAVKTFVIEIEKGPAGDVVGLDVDWGDMQKLRVTKVKPGLVAQWNAKNPDNKVEVGDYLTEINGESGQSKKLLEVVKDNANLKITVMRG
mmetsp:Transcript_155580/g.270695  ORF Transcript_155580/g.270695 Transcript_155580/m.270695 type:complete len:132 (-) Transcript_155580:201-596(-)